MRQRDVVDKTSDVGGGVLGVRVGEHRDDDVGDGKKHTEKMKETRHERDTIWKDKEIEMEIKRKNKETPREQEYCIGTFIFHLQYCLYLF